MKTYRAYELECVGGCGRMLDEADDDVCRDCGERALDALHDAFSGADDDRNDDGDNDGPGAGPDGVRGAWAGAFKDEVRDWEARARAVQYTTGGHQVMAEARDGYHAAPSKVGSELRKKVKPVEVLDGQYGLDGKMRGAVGQQLGGLV